MLDGMKRPENNARDERGRFLKGANVNPTGKGGFNERPQDRGRNTLKNSPTLHMRRFGKMTPEELKEYVSTHELNVVERIALQHLQDALKDPKVAGDVFNRLDGTPRQTIDQNICQVEPPQINLTIIPSEEENHE